MGLEFPDFLRGIALIGKYGTSYLPVAVDPTGQLYIILTGAPDVTIPGTVDVDDLNTVKQIQGIDGTTYRTAKVDSSGQFIMVPRGQSGNYMTVDASGFLTTVLKGLCGSALATVAVDSAGRMIGLIADANDAWGSNQSMGLGELASRLGGLQRWDTRGRLLDAVSFDNGKPLDMTFLVYSTEDYHITPSFNVSGGYALYGKLIADANSYIGMYRTLRANAVSPIGGELAIATSSTKLLVNIQFNICDAAHMFNPQLIWNQYTSALTLNGCVGGTVTLDSSCAPSASNKVYNYMKIVVNPLTGKCVRALWNERTYDLSGYTMTDGGASAVTYIRNYVNVSAAYINLDIFYIDHIATTYAEPL